MIKKYKTTMLSSLVTFLLSVSFVLAESPGTSDAQRDHGTLQHAFDDGKPRRQWNLAPSDKLGTQPEEMPLAVDPRLAKARDGHYKHYGHSWTKEEERYWRLYKHKKDLQQEADEISREKFQSPLSKGVVSTVFGVAAWVGATQASTALAVALGIVGTICLLIALCYYLDADEGHNIAKSRQKDADALELPPNKGYEKPGQ